MYELEFPAGSFDVVHAHQVLQHLSDPITALREMRRVCVPGGLVAVRDADYAAMTWYPPSAELSRWLELYHQVARSERRRTRRWATAAELGVRGGFRRRSGIGERLVLRDADRSGLVVRDLGRRLSQSNSVIKPWNEGSPPRRNWQNSLRPGSVGDGSPTHGFPFCTVRSCAAVRHLGGSGSFAHGNNFK